MKEHQQKEPLKQHDTPEFPWSVIATDLFEWNDQHYLVLVDSYSGWSNINRCDYKIKETLFGKWQSPKSDHRQQNTIFQSTIQEL